MPRTAPRLSAEVLAAREAVRASQAQAAADRARSAADAREAEEVAAGLCAHNIANHYNDWLFDHVWGDH